MRYVAVMSSGAQHGFADADVDGGPTTLQPRSVPGVCIFACLRPADSFAVVLKARDCTIGYRLHQASRPTPSVTTLHSAAFSVNNSPAKPGALASR